jgi:hypothetical protein
MDKLTDFVRIYDNTISAKFCKRIINAFEEDEDHHINSTIGIPRVPDPEFRNAIEMNCTKRAMDNSSQWPVIMELLNKHASSSFGRYKHDLIKNGYRAELLFNTVTLEQWRMHRYDPGKHFYKEHIDAIDGHTSKRMLMMLYYLNTVDEGGETLFESIGRQINPVEGRLAITPSWFGYPHSAIMPISNTKYMIKTYLHYPGEINGDN